MEWLAGLVGGKALSLFLLLGGSAVIFGFLKKTLRKMASSFTKKKIASILDKDDEDDRELALALMKWAEAKIPDKGKGKEKYELAAKKMGSLLPFLKKHEKKIAQLLESIVVAVDNELKKANEK